MFSSAGRVNASFVLARCIITVRGRLGGGDADTPNAHLTLIRKAAAAAAVESVVIVLRVRFTRAVSTVPTESVRVRPAVAGLGRVYVYWLQTRCAFRLLFARVGGRRRGLPDGGFFPPRTRPVFFRFPPSGPA